MSFVPSAPRVFATLAVFGSLLTPATVLATVECELDLRIGSSAATIGSFAWSLDYSGAGGTIVGQGAQSSCTNLATGTLAAFTDHDAEQWVQGALLAEPAMTTPRTIARCLFRADNAPVAGDFELTVTEANDGNVVQITPFPSMTVSRIACEPDAGTTTTTTLPEPECLSWPVTFRLATASGTVGAVQFEVDYTEAPGGFSGSGSNVACQKKISSSALAVNDVEVSRSLIVGVLYGSGFTAPKDLTTCTFVDDGNTPSVGNFDIALDSLQGTSGQVLTGSVTAVIGAPTAVPCPSVCGDGATDGIEQCDDGNLSNTDACLNDCTLPACGDGFVRSGVEECDDENFSNTDACLNGCMAAKCGDGYVRAGVEMCDDGNLSNTDACLSNCSAATCGDGHVRAGVEACDDANLVNTDACLSTCVAARCGDGFVRSGVETCDDGNLSNTDACPSTCVPATCGDGFVRTGVEQCDDGNAGSQDGCTPACVKDLVCSDPTGDRKVLAGDALIILKRAVSIDVYCPDWTCDGNGDDKVSAGDALLALTASVGLPVNWKCPAPEAVVLRLVSVSSLGSLQVDLDYSEVTAELVGVGASVQCQGLRPSALYAFNDKPSDVLTMSMADVGGFTGPMDLARCALTPTGTIDATKFAVTIVDALTPAGAQTGGVQVKALLY